MTDIPEDVMKLAAKVVNDAEAECRKERYLFGFPTVHGKETLDKHIARAIMADRAAQAERMARMQEALQNARNQFEVEYRGDHISCVGHASDGLRKIVGILDAALAAHALSQEGSEPS